MVLVVTALLTGVLAACAESGTWVAAKPASSWSAQYSDAANSSYTGVDGAEALDLDWTRSVKGELGAAAALGSGRYLAVNAGSPAGCSLMVWENDNDARQRWCTRLIQG